MLESDKKEIEKQHYLDIVYGLRRRLDEMLEHYNINYDTNTVKINGGDPDGIRALKTFYNKLDFLTGGLINGQIPTVDEKALNGTYVDLQMTLNKLYTDGYKN
jgi:hypothetical protein